MIPRPLLLGLAGLVILGTVAFARPSAATASVVIDVSGDVAYFADPGESNVGTMSLAAGVLTVTEAAPNAIVAGPGCTQEGPNQASCPTSGRIFASLDDMDDRFTMLTRGSDVVGLPEPLQVDGGEGADALIGGPGPEELEGSGGDDDISGGGGDDRIFGGNGEVMGLDPAGDDLGADTIDGGAGNDLCVGDPGNDTIRGGVGDDALERGSRRTDGRDNIAGGPGRDRIDYSARTAPLSVALDGQPNDGQGGEQDNVAEVEVVLGGSAGDTLLGSPLGDELAGGPGDDVLIGRGGPDSLQGGAGDAGSDTLDGGDGDDSESGGPGDDQLLGGAGRDALDGGGGADSLAGGDGDDSAFGGAGIDSVSGGAGGDTLRGGAPALVGADGADALKGDSGNDRLLGDAGDDTLDGGLGADAIAGGDGEDTADYGSRLEPVQVTLDDLANDGAPGEGDNVATDVENIRGGRFDDTLGGDSRSNEIDGAAGEDYADGGGGSDDLSGGDQGDVLRTRGGGRDSAVCGSGRDFVVADAGDTARGDCERVDNGRARRPRLARTAIVRPVKGVPAMSPTGIRRFVPLRDRVNLPLASRLDARRGTVSLVAASGRRRRSQRGRFAAGVFQILQRRARRPLTNIVLKGGNFRRCRGGGRSGDPDSATAARRHRSRRVVRRLRGNARGRFRSRGRYSAATVRGTVWDMVDRCDGTLTRVKRGKVVVRDFRRKRNITLRAGQRYLARAP